MFSCGKLVDRWHSSIATWALKPSVHGAQTRVPDNFEDFFVITCTSVYGKGVYPKHLQRYVDILLHENRFGDRIEGQKIVVSMPPRHLKTTISLAASLYVMLKKKHTKSIWLTYADDLNKIASGEFNKMAAVWGYSRLLADKKEIGSNTLYLGSLKSPVTGKGANWNIMVDDPLKNMPEAMSKTIRDSTWANYDSCACTRSEGEQVNYVMCGTRWHSDDPQGRCLKQGYEYLHYKAINEKGEALCPDLLSLDFLLDRKAHIASYTWESIYQGDPPDGKFGIFSKTVHYADEIEFSDSDIIAHSHGIDLAYTTNSQSDLSAYVHLAKLKSGQIVLLDWILTKCNVGSFFDEIRHRKSPPTDDDCVYWYASAAEIGLSSEISAARKIKICAIPSFGKLGNVQNLVDGWNNGNVFMPTDWRDGFGEDAINQILLFTGNEGDHDDFVDALCSAYDALVPRGGAATGIDSEFVIPNKSWIV
jgi:hypothetical protein